MRISLRWKLLATYLYLTGLSIALLGGFLAWRLGDDQLAALDEALQREAKLVAAAERSLFIAAAESDAGLAPREELHSHCAEAARLSGSRVTFILPEGTVVADSEANPESMENHGQRPEVKAALAGHVGRDQRRSRTVGRPFLYVAAPVTAPPATGVVGVVRVALPLAAADQVVAHVRRATLVTILVLLLLAVPLGMFWSRRLAEPLERMVALTQRVGEGDLKATVTWQSADEVGALAEGLNHMTRRLRETYDELSERNQMLETVLARLRAGVLIADGSGRLLLANDAAASMLGLATDSAFGKPFIQAALHYELDEALRKCLETGAPTRVDVVLDRDTGRTVEGVFALASSGSGESSMAVGVLHDITERQQLAEARREFVANASHELRTPAASLRAMAETLLAGGKEDPERLEQTLHHFLEESERLSRLIADLLDLAQAERNEGGEPQRVRLEEIAVRVTERLEAKAAGKRLRLLTRLDPDAVVRSEPNRLEQVLFNLVDNAVSYTPPGGQVEVVIRAEGTTAEMQVIDTGLGIAAEHLPRLFERFYRVDKARSRETGGTGLGLAIVKHLVALDGGQVDVDSALGEGSTFTVRYPLATPPNAGSPRTAGEV